jgi:hypothetical protein
VALGAFEDKIKQEVKVTAALKALRDGGNGSTTGTTPGPSRQGPPRTLASPDWDGEQPVNFRQVFPLTGISLSDFESNNTLLLKKETFYVCVSQFPVGSWFSNTFTSISQKIPYTVRPVCICSGDESF